MKILIGMGHPKDVHLWKNVINNLKNDGHEVKILAWDKDVTLQLLDTYGYQYEVLGKSCKSFVKKAYGLLKSELISFKVVNNFKPDIFVGREPCLAHMSRLAKKPNIYFEDTEHANLVHLLTFPFSDAICTSTSYKNQINPKKHVTFNGYQELAYLHPKYFKPKESVLDELGIGRNNKLAILRLVSWGGSHDVGHKGIDDLEYFVSELEKHAQVCIISERNLDKKYEKYQLKVKPEKIHDLLYYSDIYIGEGATMAAEAGVLGTPSIFISSAAGVLGYLEELEHKYELVYSFPEPKRALSKILKILEDDDSKKTWAEKKERLFSEKIDVTKYMTDFIESYFNRLQSCIKDKTNH